MKYLTLSKASEGFYKERGSKFTSYAYPVQNEQEIKQQLLKLKKEYYDARHICYAFVLGKNHDQYRASDGGEPGNSAGPPILGQIKSKQLTNVLVVVIRYSNGTKLGVPGLIHAYKTAALEALDNAFIIEEFPVFNINVNFQFEEMNEVMKIIKEFDLKILEQNYHDTNLMTIQAKEHQKPELIAKLDKFLVQNQSE